MIYNDKKKKNEEWLGKCYVGYLSKVGLVMNIQEGAFLNGSSSVRIRTLGENMVEWEVKIM